MHLWAAEEPTANDHPIDKPTSDNLQSESKRNITGNSDQYKNDVDFDQRIGRQFVDQNEQVQATIWDAWRSCDD